MTRTRAWLTSVRAWLRAEWWHPWVIVGGLILALGVGTIAPSAMADLDRVAEMPMASTVFDRADRPVFAIFEEYRVETSLEKVSPHFIQALLAVEDEWFYRHPGIVPTRTAAALWHNVRKGEMAQGGSTITQQLARATYLSGKKTLRRKATELALALRIEWRYSKDEILQWYVNRVYFGRGLYGIEAASRGYFNKPARDLTLGEAALLAGLIKAPSAYAPPEHLDRAIERRKLVLARMVEAEFIDGPTADAAARAPVLLREGAGPGQSFGHYFKNHIARLMVAQFGWERVSQGGLRVYTTIDPAAQRAAEIELTAGLNRIGQLPAYRAARRLQARGKGKKDATPPAPDELQAALVSIDPRTGHVRALVGGRDFGDSPFDRVTQSRRQAGSAFKPLVYAGAIEDGYSPSTVLTGLDDPVLTDAGPWVPSDGHSTASAMTIRTALRTSSNRAAVRVVQQIGVPRSVALASSLGVEAPPAVPSMALGAGEVTLLSLTSAYGAFANAGVVQEPVFIRRVEDRNGRVLFEATPRRHQAISEVTAFLMAHMLADVIDRGTGASARAEGFRSPAGGKTGTTNDYRDAWFIGFTPALVTGVWVGFDRPRTIMERGYATVLAVPIWARFMRAADPNLKTWLPVPAHVVQADICFVSGKLPGPGCAAVETMAPDGMTTTIRSMVGKEYFRAGTEPIEVCDLHSGAAGFGFFRWIIRGIRQ